jgi:hypothetical protein
VSTLHVNCVTVDEACRNAGSQGDDSGNRAAGRGAVGSTSRKSTSPESQLAQPGAGGSRSGRRSPQVQAALATAGSAALHLRQSPEAKSSQPSSGSPASLPEPRARSPTPVPPATAVPHGVAAPNQDHMRLHPLFVQYAKLLPVKRPSCTPAAPTAADRTERLSGSMRRGAFASAVTKRTASDQGALRARRPCGASFQPAVACSASRRADAVRCRSLQGWKSVGLFRR